MGRLRQQRGEQQPDVRILPYTRRPDRVEFARDDAPRQSLPPYLPSPLWEPTYSAQLGYCYFGLQE